MSENYFDKIRIGFEMEVLIKCYNQSILTDLYKIEDEAQKYTCYSYGISGKKKDFNSERDDYILRVIRHKLAEYYLEIQKSLYQRIIYNFKTGDGYKTQLCDLPQGIPDEPDTKSWQMQHDGSVRLRQKTAYRTRAYETLKKPFATLEQHDELNNDRAVFENVEIVSPIISLKNNEYVGILTGIFGDVFKSDTVNLFYFNNSTTSNHIHFSCADHFKDPKHLYNICINWWHFEPLFLHFCPKWRRNNDYCKPMYIHMDELYASNPKKLNKLFMGGDQSTFDTIEKVINNFQGDYKDKAVRYASLNLLNLVGKGIGTIEVRLKHGSTDHEELIKFIELFGRFFDATLKGRKIDTSDVTALSALNWAQKSSEKGLEMSFNLLFEKILDNPGAELKNYFYNQYLMIKGLDDGKKKRKADDQSMTSQMGGLRLHGAGARPKKHYLFSYGSNSLHQINQRTGSKIKKSKFGTLHGYVRIFAGKSKRWNDGGVAALYPAKNGKVHGGVVALTMEQLEALDKFEGGYTRKIEKVEVKSQSGRTSTVSCYVYFKRNNEFHEKPSHPYLQAIRTNLDLSKPRSDSPSKRITVRKLDSDTRKPKTIGYY